MGQDFISAGRPALTRSLFIHRFGSESDEDEMILMKK